MSEFSLKSQKAADESQHVSGKRSSASTSFPSKTFVHAQLDVSQPGDPDEIEAENVAKAITNGGKIHRSISQGGKGTGINVSSKFEQKLFSQLGSGSEMTDGLRSRMESDFGHDFSGVRIHADASAAEMSRSIGAKAFTYGKDIFFNQDQYSPESQQGQSLLAHELTHVAQDNGRISRAEADGETQDSPNSNFAEAVQDALAELIAFYRSFKLEISCMEDIIGQYGGTNYKSQVKMIGNMGYIASNEEIESLETQELQKYRRELFFSTLENINSGILGGFTMLLADPNEPGYLENAYKFSEIGASVDEGFMGLQGSHRVRRRSNAGNTFKLSNYRPTLDVYPEYQRSPAEIKGGPNEKTLSKAELREINPLSRIEGIQRATEPSIAREARRHNEMMNRHALAEAYKKQITKMQTVLLTMTAEIERTGKQNVYTKETSIKELQKIRNMYSMALESMQGAKHNSHTTMAEINIENIDARISMLNTIESINSMQGEINSIRESLP